MYKNSAKLRLDPEHIAELSLSLPNNFGLTDIADTPFFKEFMNFEGKIFNNEAKIKINSLQDRIYNYCMDRCFFRTDKVYEGDCYPAVSLVIHYKPIKSFECRNIFEQK